MSKQHIYSESAENHTLLFAYLLVAIIFIDYVGNINLRILFKRISTFDQPTMCLHYETIAYNRNIKKTFTFPNKKSSNSKQHNQLTTMPSIHDMLSLQ